MMEHDSPVTEDELHAYVDGELPADRRAAVNAWLGAHPEAAAQVAAWRTQADAIRARYGAVAGEPVPERLKLDRVLARGRGWVGIAAAAAVAAFFVGGVAGWVARDASAATPSSFDSVISEAIDAHKIYVVEVRHPVEVPGAERAHMTQWLSKRIGAPLRIPDLSDLGLKLVGGRLLPAANGAAAFYMYETASGERFTMYCAKSKAGDSALRYKDKGQVAAFYWVDKNVAYAVSGPAERKKLQGIAQAVYEQVDKTDARKS
jgi:anti-sigma factor RsiW